MLTPYPDLPAAIALVAWGHVYTANCVQPSAMAAWVAAHYNKASEDVGAMGSYQELWVAPLQ